MQHGVCETLRGLAVRRSALVTLALPPHLRLEPRALLEQHSHDPGVGSCAGSVEVRAPPLVLSCLVDQQDLATLDAGRTPQSD